MKEIELYDIITLENDEEYTVVKEIKEKDKTYYLLVPVDEEEEPDVENIGCMYHEAVIKNGIEIEIHFSMLDSDIEKAAIKLYSNPFVLSNNNNNNLYKMDDTYHLIYQKTLSKAYLLCDFFP